MSISMGGSDGGMDGWMDAGVGVWVWVPQYRIHSMYYTAGSSRRILVALVVSVLGKLVGGGLVDIHEWTGDKD